MKISVIIGIFLISLPILYLLFKSIINNGIKYKSKDILTSNEREFFLRLTRALPGVFIFPQMAFSAFLQPTSKEGTKEYMSSFGRISQKRVDFALFDYDFKLICIVELDDKTHIASKDKVRDKYLSSAGIRTIRWNSKNKPTGDEIYNTVFRIEDIKQ